ncbi:MAG TPA: acyltransferase [Verrucomicrobium sp.]|nr:acyltransferase [Verrucomicrobium sp.]
MQAKRNEVLDLVRVIGIFCIMLCHSPFEGESEHYGFRYVRGFLACGATPAFFLLSGYLGSRKLKNVTTSFGMLLKEKWRTLVVPFLFWSTLVLCLVGVIKATGWADSLSRHGSYFAVEGTPGSLVSAFFGIGRPPIAYQLWFVRDLFLVNLVAFVLVRRLPRIPFLPWYLLFIPLPFCRSLGFFLLGLQLASVVPLEKFPGARQSFLSAACWSLVGWAFVSRWMEIPQPLVQLGSAMFILMTALILGRLPWARVLAAAGPGVFFVSATHEPLQTVLGRLWQKAGLTGYGTFFCFLAIPLLTYPICLAAYFLASRWWPGWTAMVTGGRQTNPVEMVSPPEDIVRLPEPKAHTTVGKSFNDDELLIECQN